MSSHQERDLPGVVSAGWSEKCTGLNTHGAAQRGVSGLIYCLSQNSAICKYAVSFGDSHYCHHPNIAEISR